jgi:hypothetical protein
MDGKIILRARIPIELMLLNLEQDSNNSQD